MQEQPQIENRLRVCKKCNTIKNLLEFPKNRNPNENNMSRRHMCTICYTDEKREKNKNQYLKNKERLKEQYRINKQKQIK